MKVSIEPVLLTDVLPNDLDVGEHHEDEEETGDQKEDRTDGHVTYNRIALLN